MSAVTTYVCDRCAKEIRTTNTADGFPVQRGDGPSRDLLVTYVLDDAMIGPPGQLHFHYACLMGDKEEAKSA